MSLLELCLLDGKEGIRGKIDEKDNVEKFAVYDSINIVCGKTLKSVYGHHVYYDLTLDGSEYKDEVLLSSSNLKFKGRRVRDPGCSRFPLRSLACGWQRPPRTPKGCTRRCTWSPSRDSTAISMPHEKVSHKSQRDIIERII